MKVLNLYAGIGGNRKLWTDVEVTAVEYNEEIAAIYQNQFQQDTVIMGDAHQYLLDHYEKFDFIWSSPPCQSNSRMMKATRHKARRYPDMRLYQEALFLTHFFKGHWVVENVAPYYSPLIKPTAILGRHYFWSNAQIDEAFEAPSPKGFINKTTKAGAEELKKWLGIRFEGSVYYAGNHCPAQVLRNCVHPELGLYILEQARGKSVPHKGKQQVLFI